MGFEKTVNAIIENLPTERQTLLFSATQTRFVWHCTGIFLCSSYSNAVINIPIYFF